MQLPALVFTQIFLSRMVFSLKKTQISTLASGSMLNSDITHSHPQSNSGPPYSGDQEKSGGSGGSDPTLAAKSRKSSVVSEKGGVGSRSASMKRSPGPYSQSRRPSVEDGNLAAAHQSHRRGSSVTLAPSPHPSGDYKFGNYSMTHSNDSIPPVPAPVAAPAPAPGPGPPDQTVPIPPFSTLPAKYQNYRAPHRNIPGGRFRRQAESRNSDTIDIETALKSDLDDSHQSEAGDRVLEIRSAYSQPPAVYPYLFAPPGTAASSLPPPTATSDVANRSSGESEYLDGKASRVGPTQAVPAPVPAKVDASSVRQSYRTPGTSASNTSPI